MTDRNGYQRTGASPVLWIGALAVGMTMLLPVAYLVGRSLTSEEVLLDQLFRSRTGAILIRSLLLASVVTSLATAVGVPLAWLTARTDLPLRRLVTVISVLPLVIPSYLAGFLYAVALGPKGLVQGWLAPLGVDRLFDIFGLPGAAFTLVLLSYPYVLLPVRAALLAMDPALEEAARSLGRRGPGVFSRVTVPMIRPALMAGALLAALYTLSDFGAVSLMRYETFTWAIYIQYQSFERSLAAGLSLVLAAVALLFLFAESRTRSNHALFRTDPGTARPARLVHLGRWRWPAFAFAGTVAGLALFLPAGVLGYWVVRGVSAAQPLALPWEPLINSLYVSLLAAGATLIVGLPVAILAARSPGWLSGLLERSTYIGFALPGVAVALGIVFFGAHLGEPLYQSTMLLIFAYVVLFLPAGVGATRTALLQISPRLEEAARSLGRTALQSFGAVTLPLMWRGTLAGAALVFLLTMKELPATLILSPIGFESLATAVWSAANEALFAQAALTSLVLVLAASLPLAVLLAQQRRAGH